MNEECKRYPWFRFWAQDFLCGTLAMSAEAVGGYIRLLCYQWEHGEIAADDASLMRISGVSPQALAEIKPKFRVCERLTNDERSQNERLTLVNDRLETERDHKDAKSAKAKASAEKRHPKAKKDANAKETQSERKANAQRTMSGRIAIQIQIKTIALRFNLTSSRTETARRSGSQQRRRLPNSGKLSRMSM